MFKLKSMAVSTKTADYYKKDDYYVKNDVGAEYEEGTLHWTGRGSALAGLAGPVTTAELLSVLRGYNPNPAGPTLSKEQREYEAAVTAAGKDPEAVAAIEMKQKPRFWDGTFSAPKSVSVAALVLGDDKAQAIWGAATAKARDFIETDLITTRVRQDDGSVRQENTGNAVSAMVRHFMSRMMDPQLHEHTAFANATIDPKTGQGVHIETKPIYDNQRLITRIAHNAAIEGFLEAGYDIRVNKDGSYELAAIPHELNVEFSKRHEQIAARFEAEKPASGAEREIIANRDRDPKGRVSLDHQKEIWRQTVKEMGYDPEILAASLRHEGRGKIVNEQEFNLATKLSLTISDVFERFSAVVTGKHIAPYGALPTDKSTTQDQHIINAVSHAIRSLEHNKAVFGRMEVLDRALALSPPGTDVARIKERIAQLQEERLVVVADRHQWGGLTTDAVLRSEAEIVQIERDGRGAIAPIMSREAATEAIRNINERLEATPDERIKPMTKQQSLAAVQILSSSNSVVGLHGIAGSGKSTSIAAVHEILKDRGMDIEILAPSHVAKRGLEEKTKEEGSSVARFLLKNSDLVDGKRTPTNEDRLAWSKRRLIVDEAAMIGNTDLKKLLTVASKLGATTILLYDTAQHSPVSAGLPLQLLKDEGLDSAKLTQILRQNKEKSPELYEAAKLFSEQLGYKAVHALKDRVIPLGETATAVSMSKAAAEKWIEGHERGLNVSLIAVRQQDRRTMSADILDYLEKTDKVTYAGTQTVLMDRHLTPADKQLASNYRSVNEAQHDPSVNPNVLTFHLKTQGFKAGATYLLQDVDTQRNILILTNDKGETKLLNLNTVARSGIDAFSVFERTTEKLYVGADYVWERSDSRRSLFAGDKFTLTGAGPHGLRVLNHNDGRELVLSAKDHQRSFIGPGYAETSHRAQSRTNEGGLTVLVAPPGAVTNAASYVGVTRDRENTLVITSTVSALAKAVAEKLGQNDVGWAALWDGAKVKPDLSIVSAYGLKAPQNPAPHLGPTRQIEQSTLEGLKAVGKEISPPSEPSIKDVSKALDADRANKEPELDKGTPPPHALPGRGT